MEKHENRRDILLIEIKYKTLSSKIVWYVKPVSFCIVFFLSLFIFRFFFVLSIVLFADCYCWAISYSRLTSCLHITVVVSLFRSNSLPCHTIPSHARSIRSVLCGVVLCSFFGSGRSDVGWCFQNIFVSPAFHVYCEAPLKKSTANDRERKRKGGSETAHPHWDCLTT